MALEERRDPGTGTVCAFSVLSLLVAWPSIILASLYRFERCRTRLTHSIDVIVNKSYIDPNHPKLALAKHALSDINPAIPQALIEAFPRYLDQIPLIIHGEPFKPLRSERY